MSFKRSHRLLVYNKFNGHCAYCGCEISLSRFQVDHIKANKALNEIIDLNPSCRPCNYFKSNLSIEDFRLKIESILYVVQHKTPNIQLLKSFSLIYFSSKNIVFYFEKFH